VLTIPLVNDAEGEGNENFVLGFSNPGGASIGARSTTTVTITAVARRISKRFRASLLLNCSSRSAASLPRRSRSSCWT